MGAIIMILFDKLWETMREKGVSTYALREKHNIDTRTIRRLKANENTTTDTLNALCRILDCGLQDIAEYRKDEPQPDKQS
ncbi:MAG: helix-turn-helix transcriptional regulator [Lawsonibacter sp.]